MLELEFLGKNDIKMIKIQSKNNENWASFISIGWSPNTSKSLDFIE